MKKQMFKSANNKSIKLKLISFITVLLAITGMVGGLLIGMVFNKILSDNVEAKLDSILTKSIEVVDSDLKDKIMLLESVARKSEITQYGISSAEVAAMLESEASSLGFQDIMMIDAEGNLYNNDNGNSEFYKNIVNTEEYQIALSGTSAYSTPVLMEDDVYIHIVAPIHDRTGQLLGALMSAEPVNKFSTHIIDDKTISFIVDNQGDYIAHSDEGFLQSLIQGQASTLEVNNGVKEKMVNSGSGFGSWILESDNSECYIAYGEVETTGWTVAILEPKSIVKGILYKGITKIFIIVVLILLFGIAGIYAFISRKITNNIEKMTSYLGILAKGDFRTQVDQEMLNINDEIGEASRAMESMRESLNSMVSTLSHNVENMKDNSDLLNVVSKNSKESSQGIANVVEEMATAVQGETMDLVDISETINEFGQKLEKIVEKINTINSETGNINNEVISGNQNAESLSRSVEEVNGTFDNFASDIKVLDNNINKITDITVLINSIAEQTNLLALNASIEAARAGEAGKGFAVVADEIRILAEQCKKSAEDITHIIQDVSKDAKSIIDGTGYLGTELHKQIQMIDSTVDSYENIAKTIKEVVSQVSDITSAVHEIDNDKEEIICKVENSTAVSEEISASTQEVAASAREMTSGAKDVDEAAEKLLEIATEISNEVEKFKI